MRTKILIDALAIYYPPNTSDMVIYRQLLLDRLRFLNSRIDRIPFTVEEYQQTFTSFLTTTYTEGNFTYMETSKLPKMYIDKNLPVITKVYLDTTPVNVTVIKEEFLQYANEGTTKALVYAALKESKLVLKIPKEKSYLVGATEIKFNCILEDPMDWYKYKLNYITNEENLDEKFRIRDTEFPMPASFIPYLESRHASTGASSSEDDKP